MHAWRLWVLGEDDDGPVLKGPERFLPMLARKAATRCGHHDDRPERCPVACGIYSAASRLQVENWAYLFRVSYAARLSVLGRVALVGWAVRSSFLMTTELRSEGIKLHGTQRLHPAYAEHASALSDRYGVPFRVAPNEVALTCTDRTTFNLYLSLRALGQRPRDARARAMAFARMMRHGG